MDTKTEVVEEFTTLNIFLEDALGRAFDPVEFANANFTPEEIRKAREAVQEYEAQFIVSKPKLTIARYPKKADRQIRVLIPEFRKIVFSDRNVSEFSISDEQKVNEIRKALLFCESLLITTPHIYDPTNDAWLDLARKELQYLAQFNSLIRGRLLIPIPDLIMRPYDWSSPWKQPGGTLHLGPKDERMVRSMAIRLRSVFPNITEKNAKIYVINALRDQQICLDCGSSFDIYSTSLNVARAYSQVIKQIGTLFTTNEAQQPITFAQLHTDFAIDPTKVSDRDIISIRQNEEIFEEWRCIVRECLSHISCHDAPNLDKRRELQEFTEHRSREWRERAKSVMGRGVMANMYDLSQDVIAAGASVAFAGLIKGSSGGIAINGVAAAAGVVLKHFVKLSPKANRLNRARISFRNHLLAIGSK